MTFPKAQLLAPMTRRLLQGAGFATPAFEPGPSGASLADELDIDTLEERLRDEERRAAVQVFSCPQVCAWIRV